ncbi:MAG: LPD38 domain-containing protein, partial [Sulfuricella sp.]
AALGKEITVNFNRKGQATGMMGALYAFTNARVQGTARVWKTLSGPAGTKIILGGLTLGVLQALALSAAGMGDDEPPEFIKDKSTIIPLGSTGKYIAIPMPLGYNYIPAIGRKLTELALRGGKNPGKTAFGILEALMDGLNPMGSSTMAQTLAPTIADPLISIAENKNWNGQPIHKEDRSSLNPTPGYTRFKDSASGLGKVVAKAINYLTSGFDNYKKGYLSPTPDDIDYLISQATGGVGKEAVRTWTVASGVYNGEDVPAYKVPLFGRLYGNTKEPAAEASKFYKNLTEINQHEYAVKERIKNKENPSEYIKDNPDAKLYESANRIEREISQLNQKKRLMVEKDVPRERVKVLEMAINARMKRFNDVVEKYRATSTQQK